MGWLTTLGYKTVLKSLCLLPYPWVLHLCQNYRGGLRFFTYFPEEFPAQVSKVPHPFFSGLSNSQGYEYLLSNPKGFRATPIPLWEKHWFMQFFTFRDFFELYHDLFITLLLGSIAQTVLVKQPSYSQTKMYRLYWKMTIMVIFQYNLYIFGIHLWTVLYPKPCYNEPCYKEIVVYLTLIAMPRTSSCKFLFSSRYSLAQ